MTTAKNGAPRPETGACATDPLHHNHTRCSLVELIARIVPNAALLADFIALAALLHRPDWAARRVNRLHPADFAKPLHQCIARMAIAHVKQLGRADLQQIYWLVTDSGEVALATLDLELRTVGRVADLLVAQPIFDWAADALIADRQNRQIRGAP